MTEIERQRRFHAPLRRHFKYDVEAGLTPAEANEIKRVVARGRWVGVSPLELREAALLRAAREEGNKTSLEKRHPERRPVVSPLEIAGMVAITLGAFFTARYVVRKRREAKAQGGLPRLGMAPERTADLVGLDVVRGLR